MVLDGLDFDIYTGECLVILGRSGSGKSVTLRQLNGLEKPDAGSVVFDGTDLTQLEERELFPFRRRIAMLFQSGALFDSMNVLRQRRLPLARAHEAVGAGDPRTPCATSSPWSGSTTSRPRRPPTSRAA